MPGARLVAVVSVLLCACAGWDTSTPSTPPPRAEGPVPSHVAPDANDVPLPPLPEPPSVEIKVAIASVQLLEDCPDPAPAATASARQSPGAASLPGPSADPAERSQQEGDSAFAGDCTQSTVQLSVRSDVLGPFRVEAVRVLDPKSQRAAGTATLRGPTRWSDSMYSPWDGRVDVKTELKISYKLGALDLTRAAELVGPDFSTYMGPFVLELDVSVDGHRQTIRSAEFAREPPHIMVT